ncbi:MAG: Smr/MutS family protein [Gammaproteobacteria bacterium]
MDKCFILKAMKKKPPARAPALSPQDRDLFREAVGDVRPLDDDGKIRLDKPRPPPRARQRERDEQQVLLDMLSDPIDLAEVETGEELLFSRNGVQPAMMKKLRRGLFAIEAELDLHRMTSDEARQATAVFLQLALQAGKRCVRIIHGKGHGSTNKLPVLKTKVNHWLRQRDEVLAFCSARPADGGTGAIYVLLRAQR